MLRVDFHADRVVPVRGHHRHRHLDFSSAKLVRLGIVMADTSSRTASQHADCMWKVGMFGMAVLWGIRVPPLLVAIRISTTHSPNYPGLPPRSSRGPVLRHSFEKAKAWITSHLIGFTVLELGGAS
ncbi:hypothetical protein PSHT_08519 [Puccinia striiformis]|uniref:Uncharacterized protein n=1 Tax=Puccinia striiformis TaxID=27350 RepID=A0A2S4VP99_9BASI|nr:hypothetical protein PSHT_08519 [Puccinia striiformis]